MPVYEYDCPDCGIFPEFRRMEERNLPVRCPACAAMADRVVSAPNLALMNPGERRAHSTNERSRHEPRVSTRHTCSSGCGCGAPRAKAGGGGASGALAAGAGAGRPLRRKNPAPRPWMLGH